MLPIFSRYEIGIMFASDVWWRVITRVAESAVIGGLSSCCKRVQSVLIRNSDMLMLRTVKIVRRRLRNAFRKMSGKNFIVISPLPWARVAEGRITAGLLGLIPSSGGGVAAQ